MGLFSNLMNIVGCAGERRRKSVGKLKDAAEIEEIGRVNVSSATFTH